MPRYLIIPALLFACPAVAQTSGNFITGQVLTAPELNSAFAGKQDYPPPASAQPATDPPLMAGTAAVGTSLLYAREDHVHPTDTSLVPIAGTTMTGPLILSGDPTTPLGAVTKQYVDGKAINCGSTANAVLSLDPTGTNCQAATGLTATASGPNVAPGYTWLYNGVTVAWAQTSLSALYLGTSGTLGNTGQFHTAVGFSALINNSSANNNTAIGYSTLRLNSTGSDNTGIGFAALTSNTGSAKNVAVGSMALYDLATGAGGNNVAIGYAAVENGQTIANNTGVGTSAGIQIGSNIAAGSFITGNGYTIQTVGTTDFTLIGASANTPGTSFTASGPGTGTGQASANSTKNLLLGYQAAFALKDGNNNVVIGGDPGIAVYSNTLIIYAGANVPRLHNWGTQNIFVGENPGNFTLTGTANACLGYHCLIALTSGGSNVAIGPTAGQAITTSNSNVAVGSNALRTMTTGSGGNTGVGTSAGTAITVGALNTLVGNSAGQNLTTPNNNICIGYNSCGGIQTGASNVVIGSVTGLGAALASAIIIGDGAGNIRLDYGNTTAARWTASAGIASPQRFVTGASPTNGTGTCVPSAMTGGNTAGTFTIPAANCAAATTVILGFASNATNGWTCTANNLTATARNTFVQTATAAGSATLTTSGAVNSGDVIQFQCTGY